MAQQGRQPPGGRTIPGGPGAVSPFGETVAPTGMPPMVPASRPAPPAVEARPVPGPVVGGAAAEPTAVSMQTPVVQVAELGPGVLLGDRYKLKRTVGSGGMGDVWEAQHVVIGKAVAVKILSDAAGASTDSRLPERFMREARAIAAVRHENIVDITDFGHTPGGAPYFVMELLHGRTLKQLIKEDGPVPWERARQILAQLADGLEAVHAHGIIHRDLKPDNVFILDKGRGREQCKIIDFGIAKLTQLDSEAQNFTRTGMVFGTPAFMSPEQARGEGVDARTDVYSFGCVAYELITGRKPFEGTSPTEVLFKQLFTEALPPRQAAPAMNIPQGVEAIVMKCMRKGPELRFSDMAQLRDAIQGVGTTAPMVVVPHERLPTPPTRPSFRDPGATAPSAPGATLPETSPAEVSTWEIGSPHGAMPPSATGELMAHQASSGRLGTILAVSLVLGTALGGGGYFAYSRLQAEQAAADEGPATAVEAEVAAPPAAVPEAVAAPVDPAAAAVAEPNDDPVGDGDPEAAPEAAAEPIAPTTKRSGYGRPRPTAPEPTPAPTPAPSNNHLPPPPSVDDKPAPAPAPTPEPAPAPPPKATPPPPMDAPATPPPPKNKPPKKQADPDLVDPFG